MKNYVIIFLYIVVFLFSVLFFSIRFLSDKGSVEVLVLNLDFIKVIKENNEIKKIFTDNKIPIVALDYIDTNEVKSLLNNFLENLYSGSNDFITDVDIEHLIKNSVKKYEQKYNVEVYSYIESEVSSLSYNLMENINSCEYLKYFNSFYKVFNYKNIFFLFSICVLMFIFLFFLKKRLAFLVFGSVSFSLSIIIYYFNKKVIGMIINKFSLSLYLSNNFLNYINSKLEIICFILFLVGIIGLLIYGICYLKRLIAKSRILYYDKYYGR